MLSYKLILPQNFTTKHISHIREFKESITILSTKTDKLLGAKDI